MKAALDLISSCTCARGCPSCVGSPIPPFSQLDPETGGKGMIPDKEASLVILHHLLEIGSYTPRAAERAPGEGPLPERPRGKPLPLELQGKLRAELAKKRGTGRR